MFNSLFLLDKRIFYWNSVDWREADSRFNLLQHRISVASSKKSFRVLRNLQRLVFRSLVCRLVIVRMATEKDLFESGFYTELGFSSLFKIESTLSLKQILTYTFFTQYYYSFNVRESSHVLAYTIRDRIERHDLNSIWE